MFAGPALNRTGNIFVMQIMVLRHEAAVHLGHFAALLGTLGVNFCEMDLGRSEPVALRGSSGVVILGGTMSANDLLPGLSSELALIEQAIVARVPLLGICLGAQLIAKALGAQVYRNPQKEIGWAPVYLTDAGRADPVFQGMESPAQVFHWHSETFDLPSGAEWLAYSDRCRHQAFRYAESVYGIQFHPEVTAGMIADWCADPASCADLASVTLPVDPLAFDSEPPARRILEGWLSAVERTTA
jgi:GMP synthase (glutamine-hydrolysing)